MNERQTTKRKVPRSNIIRVIRKNQNYYYSKFKENNNIYFRGQTAGDQSSVSESELLCPKEVSRKGNLYLPILRWGSGGSIEQILPLKTNSLHNL